MTIVDRYFTTLQRVGFDNFWHPSLESLRRQMDDHDLRAVEARLIAESETVLKEADQLAKFGQRKFHANDN
jgi:hypothetical protein